MTYDVAAESKPLLTRKRPQSDSKRRFHRSPPSIPTYVLRSLLDYSPERVSKDLPSLKERKREKERFDRPS